MVSTLSNLALASTMPPNYLTPRHQTELILVYNTLEVYDIHVCYIDVHFSSVAHGNLCLNIGHGRGHAQVYRCIYFDILHFAQYTLSV